MTIQEVRIVRIVGAHPGPGRWRTAVLPIAEGQTFVYGKHQTTRAGDFVKSLRIFRPEGRTCIWCGEPEGSPSKTDICVFDFAG